MQKPRVHILLALALALALASARASFAAASVPVVVPVSSSASPDVALIQSEGYCFASKSEDSSYDQYIIAPSSITADVSIAVVPFNNTGSYCIYARTTAGGQTLYYTYFS